jgi:acetyl-CoA acetyltransferase
MTTYLVSGLRTAFCKVEAQHKNADAIQLSIPFAQAMTKIARPDMIVWGTVIPSLRWSNIAREIMADAKLDATIPAYSTVQACSTSMVGVFQAAGLLSPHAPLALVGGVEAMSQVQIGLTQGFSNWLRSVMQARSFGARIDAKVDHWNVQSLRFDQQRADQLGTHSPATMVRVHHHCRQPWSKVRSRTVVVFDQVNRADQFVVLQRDQTKRDTLLIGRRAQMGD